VNLWRVCLVVNHCSEVNRQPKNDFFFHFKFEVERATRTAILRGLIIGNQK
jgi:hypothetical protein